MKKTTRWVGLDVHAETIALAVANRDGTVHSVGTIPNRPDAVLFFMAAPLPRGAHVLADLILRPAEEPPLLHVFNRARGIPRRGHGSVCAIAGCGATPARRWRSWPDGVNSRRGADGDLGRKVTTLEARAATRWLAGSPKIARSASRHLSGLRPDQSTRRGASALSGAVDDRGETRAVSD
jgi:hypothetical protein